jgi:hypothetical protein
LFSYFQEYLELLKIHFKINTYNWIYTVVRWKETVIVHREPFLWTSLLIKKVWRVLPLSGIKSGLVSRKLGCPLSNGIWTSVSWGHTESNSFQMLLASSSIQKFITVKLLLLVLLKSFSKYACQYLWEKLVIFLAQMKQEDSVIELIQRKWPKAFVYLFIFVMGKKNSRQFPISTF